MNAEMRDGPSRAPGLEQLRLGLSNRGTFDDGVEAARNACVAGAPLAAAAITAAAWYDNPFTGTPALRDCMQRLGALPLALDAWLAALAPTVAPETGGECFSPGFGFVAPGREPAILALLEGCVAHAPEAARCRFVLAQHEALVGLAGPLNVAGACALAFLDHGVDVDTAERTLLLWRLDVALREALGARRAGVAAVPFGGVRYAYEGTLPPPTRRDRRALLERVGLDIDPDPDPDPDVQRDAASSEEVTR